MTHRRPPWPLLGRLLLVAASTTFGLACSDDDDHDDDEQGGGTGGGGGQPEAFGGNCQIEGPPPVDKTRCYPASTPAPGPLCAAGSSGSSGQGGASGQGGLGGQGGASGQGGLGGQSGLGGQGGASGQGGLGGQGGASGQAGSGQGGAGGQSGTSGAGSGQAGVGVCVPATKLDCYLDLALENAPPTPAGDYRVSKASEPRLESDPAGDRCCYDLHYTAPAPPCGRPLRVGAAEATAPLRRGAW